MFYDIYIRILNAKKTPSAMRDIIFPKKSNYAIKVLRWLLLAKY